MRNDPGTLAGLALAIILLSLPAWGQQAGQGYANYQAAMQAAEKHAGSGRHDLAIAAFREALNLAKTDAERAAALMGIGASEERVAGRVDAAREAYAGVLALADIPVEARARAHYAMAATLRSKPEAAREEYNKALKLPGLGGDLKAEGFIKRGLTYKIDSASTARLAMADFLLALTVDGIPDRRKAEALVYVGRIRNALGEKDQALEIFGQATMLTGATDDSRGEAYYWAADILSDTKKYAEARGQIEKMLALPRVSTDLRINAHRLVARTYLIERNTASATTEIEKISSLAGIEDRKKREIFEFNGDFLARGNAVAGARAEYEKALAAPGINPDQTSTLCIKIASVYLFEGERARAREYLTRSINTPTSQIFYKAEALQMMGALDYQDRNYAAAAESWKKVIVEPRVNSAVRAKAVYGTFKLAEMSRNYAAMGATINMLLGIMLNTVLTSSEKEEIKGLETSWKNEMSETFLKMAAEPTAADVALAVYPKLAVEYSGLEEFVRNRCHLAAGDLYAAQGKAVDAKLAYRRVTAGSEQSKPQKEEALKKIEALESKPK